MSIIEGLVASLRTQHKLISKIYVNLADLTHGVFLGSKDLPRKETVYLTHCETCGAPFPNHDNDCPEYLEATERLN